MALVNIPIQEVNAFDLPPVCVITGAEEGVSFRKVQLSWHPPWVWLLIFVPFGGLFLVLIVAMVLRKRLKAELAFTATGWARRQRTLWLRPLSLVGLIMGVVGSITLMVAEGALRDAALPLFLASLAFPFVVVILTRKSVVQASRISATHVFLKLPSEVAARRIAEHLRGARLDAVRSAAA
jgi:hypothetical protein